MELDVKCMVVLMDFTGKSWCIVWVGFITPELRVSRIRGVKNPEFFFLVGSRFITSTFGLRVFLSKN